MTTAKELADQISKAMEGVTDGPWEVYEGCSWRRIGTVGRDYHDCAVLAPTIASDGHPDLTCYRGNDLQANLDYIALCNPANMRIILSALADAERERDEWRKSLDECQKQAVKDGNTITKLQAWQKGSLSCREAEEERIDDYRTRATAAESKLAEALALAPGEPVAWQWRQSYSGIWGNWNDCGLLAVDQQRWIDLAKKLQNEVQVRPLYTSPTPHPSVDRDALLEEARRVIEPFQRLAASVFRVDEDGREMNATKADDRPLWGFDNTNITYGDLRAVRSFLSKLEAKS
jgi:hypothetical protein